LTCQNLGIILNAFSAISAVNPSDCDVGKTNPSDGEQLIDEN
jgi:hypothetical protein